MTIQAKRVALAAGALIGITGCEGAFNVYEEPQPTQAQQPETTPTPTPWLLGHLTLVPDQLDFGPVPLRCRSVKEIGLRNAGQQPLQLFGVATALTTTAEFAVDDYTTTIDPFETLMVPIGYSPVDVGTDDGILLVQSDDPNQGVVSASLSGRDSRVGERLETFFQPPGVPADFIWLFDTSGSMSDDAAKVRDNFGVFMTALSQLDIDYQMAIITTSLDDSGEFQGDFGAEDKRWITRDMGEEGIQQFLLEIQDQYTRDKQTDERGLDSLNIALSEDKLSTIHAGFVRPNARLVITAFSDEDDHSLMSPANVAQRLRTVKASGGDIVFSSIVGTGSPVCYDEEGISFMQLSYEFGGYVENVCSSSYTQLMATLGSYGSSAESIFELSAIPEVAYGFTVTVDGEPLEQSASADDPTGWHYDAEQNAIVFGVLSVPPSGSEVNITYVEIAGSCP